jgi:uncharacterized protein with FMN-binding domain
MRDSKADARAGLAAGNIPGVRRLRPAARMAAALTAAAVIAAAAALAGCSHSPEQIELSMPDLAKIPDGTYTGEAKQFPVQVKVEVTVVTGKITGFKILKHRSGRGRAAESLAGRVVEQQTIEIDAVTGATYSSMVILKAGENALRSGLSGGE